MSYTETGIVEMELVRTFEENENVEEYLKNLSKELKLNCDFYNNIIECINYDESGYFFKNNKLFKILHKERTEELEPITIKTSNKVLFVCSYYNGGTDLTEMLVETCKV